MKIRVSDAPVRLVRVQINEHVRYVRRKGEPASGNGRPHHTDGVIPVHHPEEPVFEAGGCQVFIHPYADRTEVIVVKTFPRGCTASAA